MQSFRYFLIVLVVLGVGYVGFDWMRRAPYGVSDAAPLGTFAMMDAYLTEELGLVKERATRSPDGEVPRAREMWAYKNRRNEYESVVLFPAADGSVTAVATVSWLGDFGTRSPVYLFSQSQWRRAGGEREPTFQEEEKKSRSRISRARLGSGDVEGWWRVWEEEGARQEVTYLSVR